MEDSNKSRDVWLMILFALLLLAGLAVLVLGVREAIGQGEYVTLGLGLLAVTIPASLYALAGSKSGTGDMGLYIQEQNRLLKSINDRMLISDQAKRIAFRQKDRDALREAIIEDLRQEDYDAAMALVNEMADEYGYREEAEQFRQQIIDVQAKKREVMIQKAVARIDELCERKDWDLAKHEVSRLQRLYPDYPTIDELPQRVAKAVNKHKLDIERQFLEAAERDDVDAAMELIKEMDKYLTPEEAAPFLETARGVVGKKRQNLGVRFKMAVQDRDWIDGVRVGEQIIKEFPNSMMAKEVREMLDTLRERAASQRAAMAGGQKA
ncbi:hypothetical protein HED60_20625 [Planctomycetales bacterium ZRK34]|nr:hypothetical protein HED60_20625 [Planctomycetales bacterium ZRK34]